MKCPIGCFRKNKPPNEQSLEGPSSKEETSSVSSGADPRFVSRNNAAIAPSKGGYYRWTLLSIWIIVSLLFTLDRIYTNFWPRQNFSGPPCNAKCGGDFFCGREGGKGDGSIGCLRPGPWSAKVFDLLARASSRIIITTTNLMFLTVSHCTWNWLSERKWFKPYLYEWRTDNLWVHSIGGWTLVAWTLAHMYSLLLPSIFNGYQNVHVKGVFTWPAQINLNGPQIDVENKLSRWGSDDVWRACLIGIVLVFLVPYSRSSWGLRKNFSLAMWIHVGCAFGYFIDSFRRRTHPHVWILNTPFVAWYIADRIASVWWYRSDRNKSARRIILDKNYMLLLWKQERFPKKICDLYWIKERTETKRLTMEWSHPFTVASAHYIKVQSGGSNTDATCVQSMIEVPVTTDPSWDGHRFALTRNPCDHCKSESSKIIRMDTTNFYQKRVDNVESSIGASNPWDCIAVVRIQRKKKKDEESRTPKWLRNMCGLFFRTPVTEKIADRDIENNAGMMAMNIYGPYRSGYGRLSELPCLPPLIVIGTGAGASLCLDVVAHIREHNTELNHPVRLYYSAASLPLLQFVTNNLLAAKIPGLTVQTALTRNEDLEFEDSPVDEKKGQLQLNRFSVKDIVSQAIRRPKPEVYFCGAWKINEKLKKECSKRRIRYIGSSVS